MLRIFHDTILREKNPVKQNITKYDLEMVNIFLRQKMQKIGTFTVLETKEMLVYKRHCEESKE